MSAILHNDILECLPKMRGFARRLTRDHAMADDLVQTAVMRALSNADKFAPGSNFQAWISTILRNSYFNEIRTRARRPTVDFDVETMAASTSGGQEDRLHIRDFTRAFRILPPAQRRALLLVGADGLTYEEAADVEACAVGTMKSRVSRARLQLRQFLAVDQVTGAAVIAPPLPPIGRRSVVGRPAGWDDPVAAA
jgi:RNA polymerase sigma-70 factor (ECF subfamily)